MVLPLAVISLALIAPPQPSATPTPIQEPIVTAILEDLRKAEMLLDLDILEAHVAHSFTFVDPGGRIAGSFAYLEPLRRLKERKGNVKRVYFEDRVIQVYGASAIATYHIDKVWIDQGERRRKQGWCTDVFERRDDGAWLLVLRQRP